MMISELNGWPACALVNASPVMLPWPAHDSGPGRVASPFPYGSFIRYSLPVLTGAFPDPFVFPRRRGMTTLVPERDVFAESVRCSGDSLTVELDDGRSLSVPLAWYPRLLDGTQAERDDYELIGGGEGIHWPRLDEDISVVGLLAGRRSAESAASLAQWRRKRQS